MAGSELERELARGGVRVPEDPEGYAIAPLGGRLVLASRSRLGLRHGEATLRQLELASRRGDYVPMVRIADFPSTPIRYLGGWALWRSHGLREAIEIAHAFKGNRVLYNGWGWLPGDELTDEDRELVTHARDARGVELVFELRRMSFGREHRISELENRRSIVEAYVGAARSGFRSFGLLFDDVPWETAEDECALACEVLEAVVRHAPGGPGSVELFVCPQFYWNPGQMNGTWTGRAGAEETERQHGYLEAYGKLLPAGVHVYVANYWGGHPDGYAQGIGELTELLGRRPIFFDNEVINDYRHGAVLPFAIHSRPRDFAQRYAGYYLNCGCPLEAYAPAAATALAYAWNPGAYRGDAAMGRAIACLHGKGEERLGVLAGGIEELRALANEWAGGVFTAVSHYATLWRQIVEGRLGEADFDRWSGQVAHLRSRWETALEGSSTPQNLFGRALEALARDARRLESDLRLFRRFFEAQKSGVKAEPALARAVEEASSAALGTVGAILPPAPGLDRLLEDPNSLAPREAQAWSWIEYFHRNTRRTLNELSAEMRARLTIRRA